MKRVADLWRVSVSDVCGSTRNADVIKARCMFVFLALADGWSHEKISEFTHWNRERVIYYAGEALANLDVMHKMKKEEMLKMQVSY